MDLGLKKRIVLVTGGSKGIGKEIARAFVEEGAQVAIAARGLSALEETSNALGGIPFYQGDLTIKAERERIFQKLIDDFGTIDVLVNNVGGSNGSSVEETDLEQFEQAMALNYYSTLHFSKMALEVMKKRQRGAILNITSIFGRESGGKVSYNNSKAAVISFTKALADEAIPYGVRVNGIAPGAILHPTGNWQKRLEADPEGIKAYVKREIPAGRFGKPEEVANVAVFLASEKASWVTGATLQVDGGQSRANF
ncbi:MAG: SDR family NAD(P)-dependent oxidoreductase [Firmicutes bacterium]|uniref:3-oxoacyl-[acyl-carrier protein] reductase n=1 Tax=Melghirimyces thermohalophilus TaxID=1236220 RepID=A0A1G6LFB5_9BACL|nr:SDR family oxidoreductase [Melghirimyces thermohalophilus]MDA8353039.1 SDR family NAD(P)-dependent oxidoreductase [Bacillota bacterium]SDC41465.1 3-oxoacyl-[acyl-carrier protein] reductase [Melghirimyces thermohalophilus]